MQAGVPVGELAGSGWARTRDRAGPEGKLPEPKKKTSRRNGERAGGLRQRHKRRAASGNGVVQKRVRVIAESES